MITRKYIKFVEYYSETTLTFHTIGNLIWCRKILDLRSLKSQKVVEKEYSSNVNDGGTMSPPSPSHITLHKGRVEFPQGANMTHTLECWSFKFHRSLPSLGVANWMIVGIVLLPKAKDQQFSNHDNQLEIGYLVAIYPTP